MNDAELNKIIDNLNDTLWNLYVQYRFDGVGKADAVDKVLRYDAVLQGGE